MSVIEAFVQELTQEAQSTRRLLERVPADKLGWKPHEKSMSLGQLALHVATIPGFVAEAMRQSPFPVPAFTQPSATSVAELVPALDQSVETSARILREVGDEGLTGVWRVVNGDQELMTMPIGAVVRSIMLNHWYHHRGQLTVYLRQLNVPLPSVYGPSADENPFSMSAAPAAAAV